jgi:sortase A
VVVTTPGAVSRYRVEWAEVVPPDDTSSLRPTRYSALTLVTCYPFHYLGNAPDRYVVRARLIESRQATAADAALTATRRRGR